jgi:hypothetical protein
MSNEAVDTELEIEDDEPKYTEEENQLLWRGLPKWPHLIIHGKPVTRDQAFEIIFRTDSFLTDSHEYAGGNNRAFNKIYQRDSGLSQISAAKAEYEDAWLFDMYANQHLREKINFVERRYIRNDWASTSYVGGPHGFCSPSGEIFHNCNVGKWPSAADVFEDMKAIVKAWPFIEFKASLYSHEECEDVPDKKAVVSFVAENGVVRVTGEDFGLIDLPHPAHNLMDAITEISVGFDREQGLPWRWVADYAKKVKELIPGAVAVAREYAEEHKVRMAENKAWTLNYKRKQRAKLNRVMALRKMSKSVKSRSQNRKAK